MTASTSENFVMYCILRISRSLNSFGTLLAFIFVSYLSGVSRLFRPNSTGSLVMSSTLSCVGLKRVKKDYRQLIWMSVDLTYGW